MFDSAPLKCPQKTFQHGNPAEFNRGAGVVRQDNTVIQSCAGLMSLLRPFEERVGCFQV